jgi:hypothetical protein
MNEMDLLEHVRADLEIDPAALLRARRRLLRRAVSPAVRRRRTARRVVAVVAVAAAAATLAVLVLPGPQGAEPAAAAVLGRAARVAAAEPVAGPGQWLHVRLDTTRPGAEQQRTVQERWVPGGPSGVEIIRGGGDVWTEPVHRPAIYTDETASVADLYAWLKRDNGDLRGDDAAFERASEVLSDSVAPAAFKARLLEAIVLIRGVRVVADGARFHGHDAVVVGREEGGFESRFAFDTRTGALLGFEGGGDPSMDYSTLITSNVVDALPQRAAP